MGTGEPNPRMRVGQGGGIQLGGPQHLCSPVSTDLGSVLPVAPRALGSGVSLAGEGWTGQRLPRASPNLLQKPPSRGLQP